MISFSQSLLAKLIYQPFLASFLFTFFTTPLVIKLANFLGLVDNPQKRPHPAHTHQGVIPRAGGLANLMGVFLVSLVFLPLDQHLKGILAGAAVTVTAGLLDDKYNLSPYPRLLTNFLAAFLVVNAGIGINFINNPLGGIIHLSQPLASLLSLFWIVWCMNMVNWSKGIDGQMPGFVAIAAMVIGILSLRFSADITQWPVTILAFVTAGSYSGFLPWNFYPQKIMPGYSGGTLAGYLLATLSILATAKVGTMVLVLGIPLLDGAYTIIRRIASGRLPFWGDRGHLHHRLLDLGWGRRKIAVFYWGISAFLGLIALNLNPRQKLYTFVLLALLVGGTLFWLSQWRRFSKK